MGQEGAEIDWWRGGARGRRLRNGRSSAALGLQLGGRPASLPGFSVEIIWSLVSTIPTLHDVRVARRELRKLLQEAHCEQCAVGTPLLERRLHLRGGQPDKQSALNGDDDLPRLQILPRLNLHSFNRESILAVCQGEPSASATIDAKFDFTKVSGAATLWQLRPHRGDERLEGIRVIAETLVTHFESHPSASTLERLRRLEIRKAVATRGASVGRLAGGLRN
mmetsp:Transcript_95516/g.270161  ORF Transcript_95516/g.270161 Transcript_95516/m.270161 type:complete len:222 (-) Transcript_95516:57-722(-)